MQLTIFNGSPRGRKSNTSAMLRQFEKGFLLNNDNRIQVEYLIRKKEIQKHVEQFKNADHVILAFPLYTDSMPSIVKTFIEALEPLCGGDKMPSLGFMVHSGFSEAIHSRFIERYLEKLAARLGCVYTGTLVKPGSEGVRLMPDSMNLSLFKILNLIGSTYGELGVFNPELLKKLTPYEKRSSFVVQGFRLINKLGITNLYWDQQLKKNGVYYKRFDRPFA